MGIAGASNADVTQEWTPPEDLSFRPSVAPGGKWSPKVGERPKGARPRQGPGVQRLLVQGQVAEDRARDAVVFIEIQHVRRNRKSCLRSHEISVGSLLGNLTRARLANWQERPIFGARRQVGGTVRDLDTRTVCTGQCLLGRLRSGWRT